MKKLYFWPGNRNDTIIIVPNGVEILSVASITHNNFTKYLRIPPSVKIIESAFIFYCSMMEIIEIQNKEQNVVIETKDMYVGSPSNIELFYRPIILKYNTIVQSSYNRCNYMIFVILLICDK